MKKALVLISILAMSFLGGCYSQPDYNAEVEKAKNMSEDNEERVKNIQDINKDAQQAIGGVNEN